MPARKIPLVVDEIYHVVNRGVASQPIFQTVKDYKRFTEIFLYYQNKKTPLKYSRFVNLPNDEKEKILRDLKNQRNFLVEIIAFCLMPNHIHFLLKQSQEEGISEFMRNIANSYTKYFNLKSERFGPLFQGRFKAVRIETQEQLLHVSRYIHLNPFSGLVVRTFKELITYPYSSLAEYLGVSNITDPICVKEIILANFKKNSYKDFVLDQANYQKELQKIKHLVLE